MSDTSPRSIPDHGVPDAAAEAEPTGMPNSDRHQTETAPAATGGNDDAT